MITTAELHRAAAREGLRFDQAEKDYLILWILSSLVMGLDDPTRWVFKGGTCLRHCYYAGYRFSEDMDFSCRSGNENLEESVAILTRAARILEDKTGMEITVKAAQESAGQKQLEIPIHYSRGRPRRQGLPAVRVHLTFDEPILTPTEVCRVEPLFSDLTSFRLVAYSKIEIVAEKLRALLQQQEKWPRPRDLYDLWYVLCHKAEKLPGRELREIFARKCAVRNAEPDLHRLTSENLREWNREAWKNQLAPMMKSVPDYEMVWTDWVQVVAEIL